jgi:hypothetical protein
MTETPQNKETVRAKARAYYHANKDRLSVKIECGCGGSYRRDGQRSHLMTQKHRDFLNGCEPKIPLTELEKHERYYEHVPCPCGGSYRRHNKAKHLETKQHKYYLERLQLEESTTAGESDKHEDVYACYYEGSDENEEGTCGHYVLSDSDAD